MIEKYTVSRNACVMNVMCLLLEELELGGGLKLKMCGELMHATEMLIPCLLIGWNVVAKAESEVFSVVSMYFI